MFRRITTTACQQNYSSGSGYDLRSIDDDIVIAHPMEFRGTADYFAPCAKLPLETVLKLLDQAMSQSSWFVSLEPKADWDRTKELELLQDPVIVLEHALSVLQKFRVQPAQCTLIVDMTKANPPEKLLLEKLSNHCSFAYAVRRGQGLDAQKAVQNQQYDYICPTIEFHPTHSNYKATTGAESLRALQQSGVVPNVVHWVVDTKEDLERVANFRASGAISNRPLYMVEILQEHGWCP